MLTAVLFTRNVQAHAALLGFMPLITLIALVFRHYARDVTRQGSRAMAAVNDNIQESGDRDQRRQELPPGSDIYDEFVGVNEQSYSHQS